MRGGSDGEKGQAREKKKRKTNTEETKRAGPKKSSRAAHRYEGTPITRCVRRVSVAKVGTGK